MPGPKMGPRPTDFDEQLIRQSPTFLKWSQLGPGQILRYACRDFVRGQNDDEERLMRRIMIARRNNLRDHHTLKRARQMTTPKEPTDEDDAGGRAAAATATVAVDAATSERNNASEGNEEEEDDPPSAKQAKLALPILCADDTDMDAAAAAAPPEAATATRKRRPSTLFSDSEVAKEMDVASVEATRSYRAWLELEDGATFVYNQKYIKGRDGHDWLLRKNIWRRMRYRRENKKMVEHLRHVAAPTLQEANPRTIGTTHAMHHAGALASASQIVDQSLLHHHHHHGVSDGTDPSEPSAAATAAAAAASETPSAEADQSITDAVEAAVAVAESYAKSVHYTTHTGTPSVVNANNTPIDARHEGATASTVGLHNPLDTTGAVANTAALDAAARLAAAASVDEAAVAAAAAAAAPDYNPPTQEDPEQQQHAHPSNHGAQIVTN